MTQALYFIVSAVMQLALLLFLLRFWLPMLRIDFRNPLAQGILRLTSPLIVPVRRLLPPLGRIDTATVLVLLVLQTLTILLLLLLSSRMYDPISIGLTAILELAAHSLNLFFFVVLASVILSWIAPHNYNPIVGMINGLAEPLLRPFRRVIPSIGGLDISPVFAIILLQAGVIFLKSLRPFPI